jgi:hypothetical protein
VTDPVRSPRESVGPKPSYQVHLLVAISVLWYVATKLFNCAEQKLSRDADLVMEASASTSVPFSFLSVPLENVGLVATVFPMRPDNTNNGDSDTTRRIAALARDEWRWIPAKVEPVLQPMAPDESGC